MITKVAIAGAAGRMGRRLIARAHDLDEVEVVSVLSRRGNLDGLEPQVVNTSDPHEAFEASEVVIDFTAPAACMSLLETAEARKVAYVLGSTGLSESQLAAVHERAKNIAVLVASNFSVGVNLLFELAETAALKLGSDFDIEISEIHHRHKKDAPSGTAISLQNAVLKARPDLAPVLGRAGQGSRDPGHLGVSAIRGGDVSGEHTVFYLGNGERLELTHRASTPDIFADGALRAACWLKQQAPGFYSMCDLLRSP
jgi:4-hydroxy-tetrahydrodipicolinate reductase